MEFTSTKGMTEETAPSGKVLVKYLEPFFGTWSVDYALAYFEDGWKLWSNDQPINVVSYSILPETEDTEDSKLTQLEFKNKYGDFIAPLGNVGE